jgi:hypothetical protein
MNGLILARAILATEAMRAPDMHDTITRVLESNDDAVLLGLAGDVLVDWSSVVDECRCS